MKLYQAKLSFSMTVTVLFVISQAKYKCHGSCANSDFSSPAPYPFGFSPGCPIQLNCSSTGVSIGRFHVLNITSTDISVGIPAECDRPLDSISDLFGDNYAPLAANLLVLQNCSKPLSAPCEANQVLSERSNSCFTDYDDMSCFSAGEDERWLNFTEVNNTRCRLLVSSTWVAFDSARNSAFYISEQVNLGWWINGECNCDRNANCTVVNRINGTVGYTCHCREGFEGDGFKAGGGCRRVSKCSASDFISGKCGGTTRVGVLVVGIGVVLGLPLLLTYGSYKYLEKRIKNKPKKKNFKTNGGLLLKQQLSSTEGNIGKTRIFTLKELETATDCFNDNGILGKGGHGTVFRGKLGDGRIVAVKKSKMVDKDKIGEFINEIVILSQIDHRNVVKLLGCCLETEVPLLVYEFVSNGTLSQYLHNPTNEFPMTWEMRVRIASEAAGAIAYLHSVASIPVYHRDIKSTNILLDENYRAKLSDFGTSKCFATDQSHVTTLVYGTIGYLDPEYFQTSLFTDKSDVYSFGVLLVELLTGHSPVSFASTSREDDKSLATYFVDSMDEDKLFDVIDARLIMEIGSSTQEIFSVAKLARRCLSSTRKNRPTMKEVAMELERILQVQKNTINCEEIECADQEIDLINVSVI